MSEEKDNLKSIKVYRFNNTKESWHEFALKFRVIADYRGYDDIISGKEIAPSEKENLEIIDEDDELTKKSKKAKQSARMANRKGMRDLIMATDGISLNIVQNSTSDKLSKGDLKKAWGRLERRWNPKTREDKVLLYTKFLNYKLENVKQRPMDWLAFMEKKRNELTNTGHVMDDETFITHLLNSLPQAEYEGVILVVKERLRSKSCDVAEVEQLLEDKYLSMKSVKGWEDEEDDYALFASPAKKKGAKKQLKGRCGYCGEIGHKAANCPDKKSKKKEDSQDKSDKKETQKPKKDNKGKGKTDMSKIKCFNCGEMGHFARNCPKPRENANLARENERSSNFGNWLDIGDNSVCEECAMICTDVYSTDESKGMIVYGDQGISSENYDEETYGDLLNTDSDDEQVIKYDVALLATDSVSLEKKRRRLNRDIPSEAPNHLSRLNENSDTKQGLTTQAEESESQEAWTMGMLSIDGDISMTNSSEQQRIEDKNKQFLYARAMHASHMIQHHMQGISERQRVIDEYRAMMDDGREMIPLDSDLHQSDLVIIQHIMQMIDTDIFWYGETFRQVITELRKKALHETTMLPGKKLDENEHRESAMMCWESLDESEPTSKKRKTLCQEEATNDPSDKIDDDPHTQRTANKGVGSIIPVNDLQLGTDDDASTLATQETLAKNLVYVTNIPDGKLAHTDIARDSSKNSSEKDGKPSSLLEKPDQLIRKDTLNAYGTSKTNDKREKGKERTTNTWRTRKIIHTEFESDNDVAEPQKNAETTKKKGKSESRQRQYTTMNSVAMKKTKRMPTRKQTKKPMLITRNQQKKSENDQALVSNEMTPSTIGSDIFIGDSAATSHMTNNKTGVYDLKPIRGSVMIGNGESISCTHKGKLDVICKHKDGSTAKHTWEVKIVPQLNHDLFSFTKAMKEGWQMHGRWKEGGLMIELSQTSKNSIKFDRMIPSGSSWLMGLKTQRLVGQAHAVIEPGKSIPILKFHHITGHTGEHLLRPTAEYMGIKLTGKLEPCEMCAQAKITQANEPKKKKNKFQADQDIECSLTSAHSSMKVWVGKDTG